jgi:hypothetical protein
MVMPSDAHAPLGVPEDEAQRVDDYLRQVPRARTLYGALKMTTLRVDGAILVEIENLVRRLEQRAEAEWKSHPIQAGELQCAAAYLRTFFPPGHALYRLAYLKSKKDLSRLRSRHGDDATEYDGDE